MGEVYRASDDRLRREVAVKILKPDLSHDQDRLRRFEQEARAAALLSHPNIVAIYDIGLYDGSPYIVSELLQGQTLRQKLRDGALPLRLVASLGLQIAQGLIAAHEKRIVHRDLKPENLFITSDGRVKILDFGIAKLIHGDPEDNRSAGAMTTETKAGSILGTVAYMSPEQLRGWPVDHRSDIFSFGAIAYEMITGARAFSRDTEVDTITAVLKEEPPEIVPGRTTLPPIAADVVRHCLEKEPANRFQSARDLAFSLNTISDASPARTALSTENAKGWVKRWLPYAVAVAALALAGILFDRFLIFKPKIAYQRVTFERGTVYSARFSPDGRSVLYGASWNGQPLHLYTTIPDSLLARPLEYGSANLLALSRTNELAVSLGGFPGARLEFRNGTLARAPLIGGTPREVLQDVVWADWSPGGQLAVVHHTRQDNLEFPIGTVLYTTPGQVGNIRFSPSGDRIAFLNYKVMYDTRGSVGVVDLSGHKQDLTGDWTDIDGLAWSPGGDEIWFTAIGEHEEDRSLWAVTMSGNVRRVLTIPGGLSLHDISADGRVLASEDVERLGMDWVGSDDTQKHDISWFYWNLVKDISEDGQWVLFEETSDPTGPNQTVVIRKFDGSPPMNLGEGFPNALSPDGKWALSVARTQPEHLTLLPVGTGEARQIPLPGIEHTQDGSHFMPDGKSVLVNGNEVGHGGRTYLVDLSGGKRTPVTPEGNYASIPSPDGKFVCGGRSSKPTNVYAVDGSWEHEIPGVDPSFAPAGWTADSKGIYAYRPGEVPLHIVRIDVATGKMTPVRDLIPADRGGIVSVEPAVLNTTASAFAYSYYQALSVLYVISGVK